MRTSEIRPWQSGRVAAVVLALVLAGVALPWPSAAEADGVSEGEPPVDPEITWPSPDGGAEVRPELTSPDPRGDDLQRLDYPDGFNPLPDQGRTGPATPRHAPESHACFPDYAGYWLAAQDGGVFAFGSASPRPGTSPPSDIVGVARLSTTTSVAPTALLARSSGEIILRSPGRTDHIRATGANNVVGVDTVFGLADDWWMADGVGGVYTSKPGLNYGSMAGRQLRRPIVGIAVNGAATGYWLVSADGGVFAFGDATFHGSMGGTPLNSPIVGIADTPSGHGYWLVASDGGIFAFGDAEFYGSMGGTRLNRSIVGMAEQGSGGYWLVASDGGIFAFGTARFFGSLAGSRLQQPVVGIAVSLDVGRRTCIDGIAEPVRERASHIPADEAEALP